MSQAPTPTSSVRADPSSNGLGLAGFILSLVGLVCSMGALSPIGLILSLVALGKEPRGFAIAGVVIGALGSCGILVTLILAPAILIGVLVALGASAIVIAIAAAIGGPALETHVEMLVITSKVISYTEQNGILPASLDDLVSDPAEPGWLRDGWGNRYRLEHAPDGRAFTLISDGPDGIPGTPDDITMKSRR